MRQHPWSGLGSLLVAISLLIPLSAVHAGDSVGGGGIAENTILFSYLNLEKYIDICLSATTCNLEGDEAALLRKIREALPRERLTKDQIQFKSENKEPGFFQIEGLVRIAKTGYRVGDIVYINQDLLYSSTKAMRMLAFTHVKPLDLGGAVSLLIHEMGHHQGEANHAKLDLLGSKVQTTLKGQMQESHAGPFERYIVATALEYTESRYSELFVRDDRKQETLSESVKRTLRCYRPGEEVLGYFLYNLHWNRRRAEGASIVRYPLRTKVALLCGASGQVSLIYDELEVSLPFKREESGELVLDVGGARISQIDCQKSPLQCP